MMHYRIGQTIPLDGHGKIIGQPLERPEWYIFTTAPQMELPSIAWLCRNGVEDAWCPTETRFRKVPRGRRKKVPYEAPVAPGYLFARFEHRPVWHVLRERSKGKITGVVSRDGIPLEIAEDAISQMKHVPARIAAIKAREQERRRLKPGDEADIVAGPLEGWTVEVIRIHAGIAYFVAPLLGEREIAVEAAKLRKIGC